MPPDDCACFRDLAKREIMMNFCNDVTNEVVDMIGGICPQMVDFTIDELVARLVHCAVYTHDNTIETDERRTAEAVELYLVALSKKLPSVVVRIMNDMNQRENPNASH